MTQSTSEYFVNNYKLIEKVSKRILKHKFREGISYYYLHIDKKQKTPINLENSLAMFLLNLNKTNGELNRNRYGFKLSPKELNREIYQDDISDDLNNSSKNFNADMLLMMDDPYEKIDMMIDINDEPIVDFLLNGDNNVKWIKIYDVIYNKKLELNMFEAIVYDYVFIKHMTISQISKVTGNSRAWVWAYRKSIIQKIKDKL